MFVGAVKKNDALSRLLHCRPRAELIQPGDTLEIKHNLLCGSVLPQKAAPVFLWQASMKSEGSVTVMVHGIKHLNTDSSGVFFFCLLNWYHSQHQGSFPARAVEKITLKTRHMQGCAVMTSIHLHSFYQNLFLPKFSPWTLFVYVFSRTKFGQSGWCSCLTAKEKSLVWSPEPGGDLYGVYILVLLLSVNWP